MSKNEEPDLPREGLPEGARVPRTHVTLEHTFTPQHVLKMRDMLAFKIRKSGDIPPALSVTHLAESLLTSGLIDLMALSSATVAALASAGAEPSAPHADSPPPVPPARREFCREALCAGAPGHFHGEDCGDLCRCEGEGVQ